MIILIPARISCFDEEYLRTHLLLKSGETSIDEISADAGYEDMAFFRRLFKRSTGLTPGQYCRMFNKGAGGKRG